MNRTEFKAWCAGRVRLLDGATGSNLRSAGMPVGVCGEAWIAEHPEPLRRLQQAYAAAGSEIVMAPTFGANRALLKNYGLEREVERLNRTLTAVSREAVGPDVLVAGDVTTTGRAVTPGSSTEYRMLMDIYTEQAEALLGAGVDLIMIETLMGLTEAMAAVEAVRALSELPVLCSFSVQADGKCYFDGSVFEAAEILPELGVDAVGVNCSNGPDLLRSVVTGIRAETALPVIAKPNAGMPVIADDGSAVYSMGPEAFAGYMQPLLDAGASIVGGCCGTTPAHIRALRALV